MHKKNIELLRNEALRLSAFQIDVLKKMFDEPGVVMDDSPGQSPQTFTRTSILKDLEVLNGDIQKLNNLEMVLAVVGTMKAGKSTSINAIVGSEVLPNRNRPMTALPTLIRHTPGQISPVMIFNNHLPIDRLMKSIKLALARPENGKVIQSLSQEPTEISELTDFINRGEAFKSKYEGVDAIYKFLSGLNDLVRLSKELNIPFPFDDYDELHEFPIIEVEFATLRRYPSSNGRLTILDTPGPNESGQEHLHKMLKEQLTKASAVLAVLDFTGLKSEADAEVRRNLLNIADMAHGRLYALVNKFDQKDQRGDSEEETKQFVAKNLMKGKILPNAVFPVSSKWAYLAMRAFHELGVNKKLPDSKQQPWVADVGKEVFGRRWESMIHDNPALKKGLGALWNDSLFNAPLERVIKFAHARAAAFSVDAAAANLVKYASSISNFLGAREMAFNKSSEELQDHINHLQKDVKRIEESEQKTIKVAEDTLVNVTRRTGVVFDNVKNDVNKALEKHFSEGKNSEIIKQAAIKQEEERDRQKSLFSILLNSNDEKKPKDPDFDPKSPIIKFQDPNDAKKFASSIQDAISEIFSSAEIKLKSEMNHIVEDFERNFQGEVIEKAKMILNEMKNSLKNGGFNLELNIPDTRKLSLGASGAELFTNAIEEKTRTESKTRKQKGFVGGAKRFLGAVFSDQWGYEDYDVEIKYAQIDIAKIKTSAHSAIKHVFDGLDKSIEAQIRVPLNKNIREFFDKFKAMVENVRGDFLQSIHDKEKDKATQDRLLDSLIKLKKKASATLLDDAKGLKKEIEPHLNREIEVSL